VNLNHLHLKVGSVERSRSFYEKYFGLAEFVRHGDILFMRDGAGMDLALAPMTEAVTPPSWLHFGFRLDTADEVERLHATLLSANVPMRQPISRYDDLVSFRCLDPDGYDIEVYWEPQPA
jgi:catechol-2,3-dioxygenase